MNVKKPSLNSRNIFPNPVDVQTNRRRRPILILGISDYAVTTTLIREKSREQKPVYYISKALLKPDRVSKNGKTHPGTRNGSQKTSTIFIIFQSNLYDRVSAEFYLAQPRCLI